MAIAIDGSKVPDRLEQMACGGVPIFDVDSGCAYRCDTCFAVIGSCAQSPTCVQMNEDKENRKREWAILGGKKIKAR